MKKVHNPTDRIGVNEAERIILKDFGWIFREQPISDYGIDAHIETVEEDIPTGKIIGLQIKTGESHFKEKKDGLLYYGNLRHLDYWINHSLPVLIIAHLPENNKTYWELIDHRKIERTKKAWKILIPYSQELNTNYMDELINISQGPPEVQKLRRLTLDRGLMRTIEKGGRIIVYTEEWAHKSMGRGPIKIIVQDTNGKEIIVKEWFVWYVGYDIEGLIEHEFAWANLFIDDDFYDMNFDSESVHSMFGRNLPDVYPYEVVASEVAHYRIELTLNELGKSFLVVSDYLYK